jgi:nucleotide-binding universal stress UspA family protein
MGIKSILAVVTGQESAESLASGFGLARRLEAYVDALHVRADPREAVPVLAEGSAGPLIDQMVEQAAKEGEGRANQAQRLFLDACERAGMACSGADPKARFRVAVGHGPEQLLLRGRVCDLIMFARIPGTADLEWRVSVEAALIESRRPVLLLPERWSKPIGEVAAIAWNGSPEAGNALRGALPLLRPVRRILFLTGGQDRAIEPPVSDAAEWLERHGFLPETHAVALKASPVGPHLVQEAAEAGADFLVMGAYGHSRMREFVFGGATRAVLDAADIPVLMAH